MLIPRVLVVTVISLISSVRWEWGAPGWRATLDALEAKTVTARPYGNVYSIGSGIEAGTYEKEDGRAEFLSIRVSTSEGRRDDGSRPDASSGDPAIVAGILVEAQPDVVESDEYQMMLHEFDELVDVTTGIVGVPAFRDYMFQRVGDEYPQDETAIALAWWFIDNAKLRVELHQDMPDVPIDLLILVIPADE